MISLLFRFYGDSTPLKQEAEKAKNEMSKAGVDIGKEFGNQLKGAVMSTVGIGAVVGLFKSAFSEASKAIKGTNLTGGSPGGEIALNRAMEATGMTREQIMEVAAAEPRKFEAMMKRFETPIPDETIRGSVDALTDLTIAVKNTADTMISAAANIATANTGVMTGFPVIGSTGFSPGGLTPSQMRFNNQGATEPVRAFIDAARSKFESDADFNAKVDRENRTIEELQKLRQAVEKS
jgi:hypothetical protein